MTRQHRLLPDVTLYTNRICHKLKTIFYSAFKIELRLSKYPLSPPNKNPTQTDAVMPFQMFVCLTIVYKSAYYGYFPCCSKSRCIEGDLTTLQCFVDANSLAIPEKQGITYTLCSHTSCCIAVTLLMRTQRFRTSHIYAPFIRGQGDKGTSLKLVLALRGQAREG